MELKTFLRKLIGTELKSKIEEFNKCVNYLFKISKNFQN